MGLSPILVAKIKSLDLCKKQHKSRLFSFLNSPKKEL
nr:MAG TPA: hypothetical protein [Caudoviricetes sp.]